MTYESTFPSFEFSITRWFQQVEGCHLTAYDSYAFFDHVSFKSPRAYRQVIRHTTNLILGRRQKKSESTSIEDLNCFSWVWITIPAKVHEADYSMMHERSYSSNDRKKVKQYIMTSLISSLAAKTA